MKRTGLRVCLAVWVVLAAASSAARAEAPPRAVNLWPSAVSRAEVGLSAKSPKERQAAVRDLLRLPTSVAVKLLPAALNDESTEVRIAAAETALALNLPLATELVVPWMNDSDDRLRRVAVRVLGAFPESDAARGALGRALSDIQPEVRREAAVALMASRRPEAVPTLLARLDDNDPGVQVAIIEALASLRDARAVVPLISKLQEPRSAVRRAAAQALARLKSTRATGALQLLLLDSDEAVRLAAVRALGALGDSKAVESLRGVLMRDRLLNVRVAAIAALGNFQDLAVVELLLEKLADPRVELAEAASHALQQLGQLAVPALRTCLANGTGGPQPEACARLLSAIEPSNCAVALATALRQDVISATVALEALALSTEDAALPLVLEHLVDETVEARTSAVRAATQLLTRRPDGRAVEPIVRALAAKQPAVAELPGLLELLGRTGAERAQAVLASYIGRSLPSAVRISALTGLSFLRTYEGAKEPVLEALADPHPGIRWAALLMVRNAAPAAWAGALLDRLELAPGQDRDALRLALSGPVSREFQASVAERLTQRLLQGDLPESDGLLEVLAHMPGAEAFLQRVNGAARHALRPKLAEMLGAYPSLEPQLRALLASTRAEVRAPAAWSLGRVGTAQTLPLLVQRFNDADAAVAANAVAAAALVASRSHSALPALCTALKRDVGYVQANALVGLRLLGARCEGERELLLHSPSAVTRERAAWLLRAVQVADPAEDTLAVERCQELETDAAVARACRGESAPPGLTPSSRGVGTTVLVVPSGEAAPSAQRAFALRSAAGFVRVGWADRKGAVWEPELAEGATLLVP